MVIGPFQPTREELELADKLGIDHSKMTCSTLRQRLTATASKRRPEEELLEKTIERLRRLGLRADVRRTTSALLTQLREHLEYLLTRRGVIEGATLVVHEGAPSTLPPAGEYDIKSVTTRQTNRLRVFLSDDQEADAFDTVMGLGDYVTIK